MRVDEDDEEYNMQIRIRFSDKEKPLDFTAFYINVLYSGNNIGTEIIMSDDNGKKCFSFELPFTEFQILKNEFVQRREMLFQQQYLKERENEVNIYLNM